MFSKLTAAVLCASLSPLSGALPLGVFTDFSVQSV